MHSGVTVDPLETKDVETHLVTPKGVFRAEDVRRVLAEAQRTVPRLEHGRAYDARQILPRLWAETSATEHKRLGAILSYLVECDAGGLHRVGSGTNHHAVYRRSN